MTNDLVYFVLVLKEILIGKSIILKRRFWFCYHISWAYVSVPNKHHYNRTFQFNVFLKHWRKQIKWEKLAQWLPDKKVFYNEQ